LQNKKEFSEMNNSTGFNFTYSPKFIESEVKVEDIELYISHLFNIDTILSGSEQVRCFYQDSVIKGMVIIEANPFKRCSLFDIARTIKCDLLHVIICAPINTLKVGDLNLVIKIMSDYLLSTSRIDLVNFSIIAAETPIISLVLLERDQGNSLNLDDTDNYSHILNFTIENVSDDNEESISELLNAISSSHQDKYSMSWVQKKLRWGYHRSLKTVRLAFQRKLIELSDINSDNPIIRLNINHVSRQSNSGYEQV